MPFCPICHFPILDVENNCDMHEAIITKGMVMTTEFDNEINVRENCVLRHHICPDKHYHGSGTGGDTTIVPCIAHLVAWEGAMAIENWLSGFSTKFRSIGDEAYLRYGRLELRWQRVILTFPDLTIANLERLRKASDEKGITDDEKPS